MPSRGHRLNIFNPAFNVFGCHSGDHKAYRHMSCMDFAGGFIGGEVNESPSASLGFTTFSKVPAKVTTTSSVSTCSSGGSGFSLKDFMAEKVDFDMPANVKSWNEST